MRAFDYLYLTIVGWLAFSAPSPVSASETSGKHEIAFVDQGIADYQALVNGLPAGVETILLDPSRDELTQMTYVLAARSGISAIHVLSHGGSNGAVLGKYSLGLDSIAARATDLKQIGAALSHDGQLLFYGCRLGAGKQGRMLVDRLAALTGAAVFANTNDTGCQGLGGDWVLEVAGRPSENSPAVSSLAFSIEAFQGLLTVTTSTIASANADSSSTSIACAPNGDVYYAIPDSGAVSGGTGIVDVNIYKFTASSSSWSFFANLASGNNFSSSDYFSGAVAIAVDSSGNLGVVYPRQAAVNNSSGTTFASSKGVYYRKYNVSTSSWATQVGVETLVVPSVWVTASDSFPNVRIMFDSNDRAVIAFKRTSGDQTTQTIRLCSEGSSGTFTGQNISSGTSVDVGYLIRAGSTAYLTYFDTASSVSDTYVVSSGNWSSPTKVIDSTSTTSNFKLQGFTANSDGSLNILYSGGASSANTASFGIISNKSGTWTVPTDTTTRISDNIGTDTAGRLAVYDRLAALGTPAQGFLVTDANDTSYLLTRSGKSAIATSDTYSIWRKTATGTWTKGLDTVSSLNALQNIASGKLAPTLLTISTDRLMVAYVEITGFTASSVQGLASDFFGAPNTAPVFVGSTTTLSVNQNASATDIKGLLHVSDSDSGQTLTWSRSSNPSNGALDFSSATASSGSSDISPGGTITYTPTAGYSGSDSFTVQVSDGTATATRTITVTVSDVTAPTVVSIVRKNSAPQTTGSRASVFTVTFSEAVQNVSANSFVVTAVNGTVAGTVPSVSGGPTVYDVTANITGGQGEFRLDVLGP